MIEYWLNEIAHTPRQLKTSNNVAKLCIFLLHQFNNGVADQHPSNINRRKEKRVLMSPKHFNHEKIHAEAHNLVSVFSFGGF